ncbi:MAG: hypothetical protein ACFB10_11595 [Salibacteraceae bacterium]
MGQEAIKLELIHWLSNLTDEETLQNLKIVKDSKDSIEVNTKNLTDSMNRASSDIDTGKVSNHEDIAKRYGL